MFGRMLGGGNTNNNKKKKNELSETVESNNTNKDSATAAAVPSTTTTTTTTTVTTRLITDVLDAGQDVALVEPQAPRIMDSSSTTSPLLEVEEDDDEDDNDNKDDEEEVNREGNFLERAGEETENESTTIASGGPDCGDTTTSRHDMPLLFYTRVQGKTLRPPAPPAAAAAATTTSSSSSSGSTSTTSPPFLVDCTCSTMGQIRWSPDMLAVEGGGAGAAEIFYRTGRTDAAELGGDTVVPSFGASATTATASSSGDHHHHSTNDSNHRRSPSQSAQEEESAAAAAAAAKLCMEEPMPITALGFSNGTVQLFYRNNTNTTNAAIALSNKPLQVREGPPPRGTTSHAPVVVVCLDITGTCLAALDKAGLCTIWEYKLEFVRSTTTATTSTLPPTTNTAPSSTTTTTSTTGSTSVFSSIMSAFTGTGLTGGTSTTHAATATAATIVSTHQQQDAAVAAAGGLGYWRMAAIQITRVSYPPSFGPSTVLALDPAYKRRREKALFCGFADGRLVLTKRGLLFQRRTDNIVYQQAGGDTTGIQALTWRGSLVAWADATGLRLLDADQLTRIAHIDPPVGARPSLYAHQLIDLKPHLIFETSHKLLVAWGDCLMQLRIQEPKKSTTTATTTAPQHSSSQQTRTTQPTTTTTTAQHPTNQTLSATTPLPEAGEATTAAQQRTSVSSAGSTTSTLAPTTTTTTTTASSNVIQRPRPTVELNMAWHLDSIVACGVAPMDADHVMVLGAVVLAPPDDTTTTDDDFYDGGPIINDMELQVVSRINGQVVYADCLPLVHKQQRTTTTASTTNIKARRSTSPSSKNSRSTISKPKPESVAAYSLLSTYCVPRMDNASELQDQQQVGLPESSFDIFGGAAAGTVVPGASSFVGPHGGGIMVNAVTQSLANYTFRDPHMRWNLKMISFDLTPKDDPVNNEQQKAVQQNQESDKKDGAYDDNGDDDDDSQASVDSDIYDFVTRPVQQQRTAAAPGDGFYSANGGFITAPPPQAPSLLIVSASDAVAVRLRTIDDAIDYALDENKAASALQKAIVYAPGLRQYTLGDIVSEYFRALLRLPSMDDDDDDDDDDDHDPEQRRAPAAANNEHPKLSLRRMKLAAYSMPVLLGGDISLWDKWIGALGNIPGSLFVVWNRVPVRDPILPNEVYTNALCRMIEHVDHLRTRDDDGVDLDRLVMEAENHFLQAFLAWGTTMVLKEMLKLYKYQTDMSPRFSAILVATQNSLRRRYNQTSAIYLTFPVKMEDAPEDPEGDNPLSSSTGNQFPVDLGTLFHVTKMLDFLDRQIGLSQESSKVVLEAKARLCMMKGDFDGALTQFLMLGALHGPVPLEDLETSAVQSVMNRNDETKKRNILPHTFVMALIENHHLHQCLLDSGFLSQQTSVLPLFALLRLVGLDLVGEFLMEHCVGPREASKKPPPQQQQQGSGSKTLDQSDASNSERSSSLPLDIVAAQLEASPKILFWYLHALFIRKPELYVSFPKTANPPASITALHRKALDLYIKFAGDKKDSSKALEGIETYRVTQVDTPLLAFIRVVLQLGGMSPAEVGKRIQIERKGGAGFSRIFALELAHIMENFGNDSEEDARLILDLYLKGAKSLMHAVSFAQRTKEYSTQLWEILVDYCLATSPGKKARDASTDGSMFGSLLESAALSGANLAHLVSKIPPGMSIEGLRPRLVAAVADYRWKLQMHEGAARVATSEKIDLLREVAHRSRRGARYYSSDRVERPTWAKELILQQKPRPADDENNNNNRTVDESSLARLPKTLRPKIRNEHNYFSFPLPYR